MADSDSSLDDLVVSSSASSSSIASTPQNEILRDSFGREQHVNFSSGLATERLRQYKRRRPAASDRQRQRRRSPSSVSESSTGSADCLVRQISFTPLPRHVALEALAAVYAFGYQSDASYQKMQTVFNIFAPYLFEKFEIKHHIKALGHSLIPTKKHFCPTCYSELAPSEESQCTSAECALFSIPLTHGHRRITVHALSLQKQLEAILLDEHLFSEMIWSGDKKADYVEGVFTSKMFNKFNNSDVKRTLYVRLGVGIDGFHIDSKGSQHCWAAMATCLNLPQRIREKLQNSLILSLCFWNAAEDPPCGLMLERFETDLISLETNGFTLKVPAYDKPLHFCVTVSFFCMDMVGHAKFLGTFAHNSYWACNRCAIRGKPAGTYDKVAKMTYAAQRVNGTHIKHYASWTKGRYKSIRKLQKMYPEEPGFWSFKERTEFMRRPERVELMPVEVLHNFYLGHLKDLLRYYFEPSDPPTDVYVGMFREEIDKFITSIMTPTTCRRPPMDTNEKRRKTGGTLLIELEVCGPIWQYVYLGLRLGRWDAVAYLQLKFCASRSLNEKRITKRELRRIDRMLELVALATPKIIGYNACTIKLHQDRHVVADVLKFGNLPDVQMFVYESYWNLFKQEKTGTRGVGDQMIEAGVVKLLLRRSLEKLSEQYPVLQNLLDQIAFSQRTLPRGFVEIDLGVFVEPTPCRDSITALDCRRIAAKFGRDINTARIQVYERAHVNGHLVSSQSWDRARTTTTSVICFNGAKRKRFGLLKAIYRSGVRLFFKIKTYAKVGSISDYLTAENVHNEFLLEAVNKKLFAKVDDFWQIVKQGPVIIIEAHQLHSMASACKLEGLYFCMSYPDAFRSP